MRLLAVALVALTCAACAAVPFTRFSKPGATQEEYMADRHACYQESANSRGTWLACMGARGYLGDPKGDLTQPPDMEFQFQFP